MFQKSVAASWRRLLGVRRLVRALAKAVPRHRTPTRRPIIAIMPRLNQFARLLFAEWRRLRLPLGAETLVVAVAGGADSTALLLAIEELKCYQKLYTHVCVAHLDHRLRKSSAKDAKWVADLAAKFGFRSVIGRSKVAETARANSDNLEQAAREA